MALLHIYKDPKEVATNLAIYISEQIQKLLSFQIGVTLLLSGGSTPKMLYEKLAEDTKIPWDTIKIFWSDERFVAMDSIDSNYKMVYDALLSKIKIPEVNIHPIHTHFPTKEEAALSYTKQLKLFFNNSMPHWDINILGIGEDCHTASLFPHSSSLQEKDKWVIGVARQKPPPEGITLTFPILNSSKQVYMLATGENKASALKTILESDAFADECPAKEILPVHGELSWWVDTNAAKLIHKS